jgi:IS605 OrfB family transposase
MGVTGRQALQRLVYPDLKAMGLSAQPAIHVARKVSGAYAALKENTRAGNLGKPGSERQVKARSRPVVFRADAAQPYDDRCLSWQLDRSTVSIWTTAGRRHRARYLRARLQAKGTKSAKRLLRKRSRKEARFAADVNHVIANRIVTEAQRTGRGIALEDLTGIRARVRLRKPQRVALHSWAFAQLGHYTAYKAALAGIPVVHVDPAYTSQMCSACGHISKKNRPAPAGRAPGAVLVVLAPGRASRLAAHARGPAGAVADSARRRGPHCGRLGSGPAAPSRCAGAVRRRVRAGRAA